MKNNDLLDCLELIMMMVILLFMLAVGIDMVSGESIEDVQAFLVNDTTDTHEWLPYYSCGHFARDLSRNATQHNITIGSVILSESSVLNGKYRSHSVNYFTDNNTIYLIEPQTDDISLLNQSMYPYYRLYYNGDQVPSYWDGNMATKAI